MNFLGAFLCYFWFFVVKRWQELKADRKGEFTGAWDLRPHWLLTGAIGAFLACSLHGMFDFQLYLAPNLLLLAILLGGAMGYSDLTPVIGRDAEGGEGSSRLRGGVKWGNVLAYTGLLAVAVFAFFTGRREIVALPSWLAVETAQQGREKEDRLRLYSQRAPSVAALRPVARKSLGVALLEDPSQEALERAAEDWRALLAVHPLDGEALANYARCLDDLDRSQEAAPYHLQAIEAVGRRESKFGVIFGLASHFTKRGQRAFHGRKPAQALFFYLEAQEVFEASHLRGYNPKGLTRKTRVWVAQQIEFLEKARIEPEEVEVVSWQEVLPESLR